MSLSSYSRRSRPLANERRVDSNIFVEQSEFDASRVPSNNAFSENDFLNFRTIFTNRTFDADVDPSTSRQVDVEEVLHGPVRKKLSKNVRVDVVGVKEEQLFELGQRSDELEAERSDVLHVDQAELSKLRTLAQLLTHRVVVVPALEPEDLQRSWERGDDIPDGPAVEVAVEDEPLEVLADPDDVLSVLERQRR